MDAYGELKKKKLTPRKDIKVKKDSKEELKEKNKEKRKLSPFKGIKKEKQKTVAEPVKETTLEAEAKKAHALRQEDLWDTKKTPLKAIKSMSKRSRMSILFVAIAIGYILFLIYGAVNSEYVSDNNGNPIPVIKSVATVSKQEGYKEMRSFYDAAVVRYKDIIDIDLKLSESGGEKKYATYYTAYLEYFDKYIARLKAVETSSQYTIIKEQLVAWVANDLCVYLQNASDAVSQNSKEKESNALSDRQRTIDDFYILTENLRSLGEDVEGVDNTFDFDPVKAYNETKEGEPNG